ncbi:MAG: hypothetical protein P0Y49_14350 [Candidatus Pedobacter colombiensis]|uniref:Prolyl-tRNA synthetase n=1 Tax=Candidatus Pedobacter colombiensis TaxID=3121371 RepID=A0AAJ5W5J1_9SPHI|nr:hypothetical protein [Pedobacter sp.]WEK17975.1 MAG: hypothetical protein P0Y49_14350 [Pedobacter sp.]
MKSNYLFTSMLALTTIVVTSCSAPRLAQQNSNDDVYNSVAQAREYKQQVPVRESGYDTQDEYYGTSDPYYDMDYSSRINRFYYTGPSWRGYYDPFFDSGWYGNYGLSFGLGFGYSPFYGSIWNSPYNAWGSYYSPFYGYNNYYGGGYYGGGLWGGGYWGGGFYTGRTTNVQDYRPRPNRGGNNGYTGNRGYGNDAYLSPRSSRTQSNNGVSVISGRPSRGSVNGNYGTTSRPATTESSRPSRTETARPATTESSRPSRTEAPARPTRESYTPPPSYTPPSRSEGSSSGGSYGGGSSGGGGGTSRPSRGGR